jgi:hypothetical protein
MPQPTVLQPRNRTRYKHQKPQKSSKGKDGIMKDKGTSSQASRMRLTACVVMTALLGLFLTTAPVFAASTATAQVSGHSVTAGVGAPAAITGKASSIKPLVVSIEGCGSSNETWVHITTSEGTLCYGGAGTLDFSGNVTYSVCAGNNYGYLRYFNDSTGQYATWQFAPGHTIAWSDGVDVDTLTISKWSGSDKC